MRGRLARVLASFCGGCCGGLRPRGDKPRRARDVPAVDRAPETLEDQGCSCAQEATIHIRQPSQSSSSSAQGGHLFQDYESNCESCSSRADSLGLRLSATECQAAARAAIRSFEEAPQAASKADECQAADVAAPLLRSWTATVPAMCDGNAELVELPEKDVDDGTKYSGQWCGSVMHGHGVLVTRDGHRYEGSFVNGQPHGHGVFTSANGNTFDGQWDRDKAHGFGKFVHRDGSSYEGEWKHDMKSGSGVERWQDGARYHGEFLHGGKHGSGIYTSGTGARYSGQFERDKMHGHGCYTFADGRVYSGQWTNGHMEGQGTMFMPSGASYKGAFCHDMKSGHGVYTWPSGKTYAGQWVSGRQHGTGVITSPESSERHGEWREGEQIVYSF